MELLRNSVFEYIKKKYSVSPEYPWKRDNTSAVFRHSDNNKWFALVMEVGKDKLGIGSGDKIFNLIDTSFMATASAKKKEKNRPPKEWIIPSNPKYYDVIQAFEEADEINWKQGRGIKTGDTIFLYVGAPVSAILYKCKVTEIDIPYDYRDGNLTIKALMKIKLIKRYDPKEFTFEILKDEYRIFAVRGPRGIPNSLSEALKR